MPFKLKKVLIQASEMPGSRMKRHLCIKVLGNPLKSSDGSMWMWYDKGKTPDQLSLRLSVSVVQTGTSLANLCCID